MVLTSNESTTIGNGQLQRRRRGPLIVTGRVIRHPDQNARHASVHASRHHESHTILDFGVAGISDDGVSDYSDGEGEKHDDTTEFEAVGDECDKDWKESNG